VLDGWRLELLDAEDYPPEDGSTYYENALAKARFGRMVSSDPVWLLGEDSGIEVAGLDDGPGVLTARFGGDDPVGTLLEALRDSEGEGRRARYVCELVCLSPDDEEFRGTGTLDGRIADQARGREGFGYDPVFIPTGEDRTVAELGDSWKTKNSHRARAARALLAALAATHRP
jgi:XTP/dITP diphosphohydrolase